MNEQRTQQLIYRSGRWPWKWFKGFREAASICEQEIARFNLLKTAHHLLKLDTERLTTERISSAQDHQCLRDEHHLLKLRMEQLEKDHSEAMSELNALRSEREKLTKEHGQMKDGVTTLFEFIRRNKVIDDKGRDIPEMPRFTNIFRQ